MLRTIETALRHRGPGVRRAPGALSSEVTADLTRWDHGGGCSLHSAVHIEAPDRAGLERLLRYCAGPAFASERPSGDGHDQPVHYTLPRPQLLALSRAPAGC